MPSLFAGGLPQCVFPRLVIRARRSIFAGDVANVDKPDTAKVAQVLTSFLLTLRATTEAIMKYVQAIIALGLFGWLSYAVFTDTFPSGENGSNKTRALKGFISSTTEQFGVTQTAIGLAVIGVLLAAFFLMRRDAD
jgi:hypothetical protein